METFSYWAKIFFTQKQTEGLSTSRIRGIKNELNHLEPLNNLKLDEINLMDIQKVINELHLSKKTLQGIKWTVKAVFENAIDNRVINFNPSIKLKIPKTATVLEREPITTEQCQWIINTSHRAKCIAMIMLFAGLRRGEVIALNWSDIDFTFKTISINKSVEFIKNRPIVKPPKTKAGNRLISIPDILANYLLKEKENSFSQIVCPDTKGCLMSETSYKRLWQSYMNCLNVKYGYSGNENIHAINKKMPNGKIRGALPMCIKTFTAHQLRHTFCTMLYFSGIDTLIAKEQMGHASITTTLSIYTHLDKKHKRYSMAQMDNYIANFL